MKIALIDNYDSFTYNLVHLVRGLGADVSVMLNDRFALEDLERYDKILLSPGPGVPSEAGLLLDVIKAYSGVKPILGVCLGHQAIAESFGAKLVNLHEVFHGVATEGTILADDPIFSGMPRRIMMGRYHSWAVGKEAFPKCLEVTAVSADGIIMALRHKHFDVRGVQFHPESILTPLGRDMMANWLRM